MSVEIGNEPHGMGELGAGIESASAFVVDQDEVEPIRTKGGCQGGHQCSEQFAFSGSGCSGDQAVRSIGDKIDEEPSSFRFADRCWQRVSGRVTPTSQNAAGGRLD